MLTKWDIPSTWSTKPGLGAGFSDQEYIQAGARIAYTPHEVFGRADLLLKVTRPLAEEIEWLRPGAALAGLLHLGSARHDKIDMLLANEITAIAYEQITLADGTVPIRKPLSTIGGMLAGQIGRPACCRSNSGGKGILIGGCRACHRRKWDSSAPGLPGPAGAGLHPPGRAPDSSGHNTASVGKDPRPPLPLGGDDDVNSITIARVCNYADMVVGAVLVPGERPPIVVTREMVRR